jgi:hypothetical protein
MLERRAVLGDAGGGQLVGKNQEARDERYGDAREGGNAYIAQRAFMS